MFSITDALMFDANRTSNPDAARLLASRGFTELPKLPDGRRRFQSGDWSAVLGRDGVYTLKNRGVLFGTFTTAAAMLEIAVAKAI